MICQYVSHVSVWSSWFFNIKSTIDLMILFEYHTCIYIRIFSTFVALICSKCVFSMIISFQDFKILRNVVFNHDSLINISWNSFLYMKSLLDFKRYDIGRIDMEINISSLRRLILWRLRIFNFHSNQKLFFIFVNL